MALDPIEYYEMVQHEVDDAELEVSLMIRASFRYPKIVLHVRSSGSPTRLVRISVGYAD